MLTPFDDYPLHQTVEPLARPSTSDRNFYGRYWFNGFDREGAFVFEIGIGLYPNRHVQDAHLSVSLDGVQHSFHASRRAPLNRAETSVGPLEVQVLEPMRSLRAVVRPNETGIECDLTFRARSAPMQEPRNRLEDGVRVLMDVTRFTQYGSWQGSFTVAGQTTRVDPAATPGIRDRSWGVRPVGEPEQGAPGPLTTAAQVYWVWAPVHWDDCCTHYGTFQAADGRPIQVGGARLPVYDTAAAVPTGEDDGRQDMAHAEHRIDWHPGTRLARSATVALTDPAGERTVIEYEPVRTIYMQGIGYQHPTWGHGRWKGDLAIESESWMLADMVALDYRNIHTHQVCRARTGDREGIGTLETIVFGPHAPSGFASILDGAPAAL